MTLSDFLSTWRGLTLENRLHRLAVLGLIGTNLVIAVALLRAERTVVLVPPVLEGQVSVARANASQEVKEAWALFVAELLGNVSPTGAEFLEKALDPLLAPSLRRPVLEVMDQQVREIQRERVSMTPSSRARFPTTPRGIGSSSPGSRPPAALRGSRSLGSAPTR